MKSFFTILLFTFISLTAFCQTNYTDKLLENSIYDSAPENIKYSKAFMRERFFFEQRAYPFTEIPAGTYDKALRQRDQLRLTNSPEKVTAGWISLGPTPGYYFNYGNISSRVVTGAYVPSNPQIIYIGPANGGVWKSTNGGTIWAPLTDNAASMSMGAIAIDPVNNDIVYAGTGEATYSGASYYGRGLLKSTDAGASWVQITSGLPSSSYFSRIIIRPGNSSHLLAALGSSGLYRSTNAGVNWTLITSSRTDDVLFSLTGDTAFAMGGGIGFRRSVDGGASFAVYGSGLPTASRMHFDMCRSNPAIMYAANYTSSSFLAYKSTNTGLTWTGISTSYNFNGGQAWYDMYVRVNPSNPNIAFIGAIDVHRTTDGGTTFTNITNGYGGGSVHVDNHYAFFHPTDSQTMIVCNDGGVWKSTNGGSSFTNLNASLTLTQFYRIASSPFVAGRILGGTQDNGTQQTYSATNWAAAFGGDGGEVCFNPFDANYILGETQNGGLQRTGNGGTSWGSATSGINTSESVAWVAPIIAHPTTSGIFFTARQSLYKSTNNGSSWTAVSSSINGTSAVRELCISKSDPNVFYASSSSQIFRSTDGGAAFTNVTTGLPGRTITSVNIDPSDKNIVLLTFSGFGGGHVYKTTNAGASWSNISSNLPDSPVNDILIYRGDPMNNNFYFIGSDIGVFYTVDGGSSWTETYEGLPNTVIMHLDYSNVSGTLRAGTHGRGVYEAYVNQITTNPLSAFNLTAPAAGTKITTVAGNSTYYTFTWDASSTTATYKWTFSSPTTASPKLVVSSASNTLSFSCGQLDGMLAAIGVQTGDSLVGQWNIMAYRNNAPYNDSLASANGPRTLTLKRAFLLLNTFSLNAPSDNSSITTYLTNSSSVVFKWRKSNDGVKYKVKWGASLNNPKINVNSDNSGNDTTWTISNNDLAIILINAGFNPGDLLIGVWAVYGYSGPDSLRSIETWNLTLKRRAKGDWLIAYDSTSTNGRVSKDTAAYNLNLLSKTFDLYNRKGNSEASSIAFRGYKGLIWLGANTSLMSLVQKDSVKAYLLSGGITASNRSKLIIFAEDVGYNLDRTGSTYFDSAFAHVMLGFKYLTDYPGGASGGRGIIGDAINYGLVDSTMNTYPDNLQSSWRNADRLYKFRITTDATGNAFGLNTEPTYCSAVFGTDMYALRNAIDGPGGSPALRMLQQVFTYLTPSNIADINLLSPNGGEVWGVGSTQNITWTSTLITNVKIEYTSNDGASWSTIVESTPASAGTFSWTVPNARSTQFRVRITNTSNPLIFSTSNNAFSVALTWQSVMTVTDNGSLSKDLTFGQELNATDGIDISLGEDYLPPLPPEGVYDVRFELPVIPVVHSIKDFRNDSLNAATWLLKFQPGFGGFPLTFTWNPSALPPGFFYLQDAYGGTLININMKTIGSHTLTNSNFTALKIVYSQQACSNINLNTGWNIVSIPVAAVNMSTGIIFPNAIAETFLWSGTGYQSVTTLTNSLGYWLKYANQASVNVCGVKVAASTIPLSAGWNMIGGYESDISVSSITTTPSGILESPFFGYENGYIQPESLIPGKGYWIKSAQNGVINIPDGTAKIKNPDAVTSFIDPLWGSIIIIDRKGNERILYTTKEQVNLNSYELPPLPPAGLFDVRYGSNRFVDILSRANLIKITSAAYPLTITAKGTTLKLKDNITGRIIDKTLRSGESLIVDNNAVTTLIVEGSEIPTEYVLYQNYPNPFNPNTTIKYGVPEKSIVKLTIYNILGQKIEELMNKELEPGYYNQVWNASNLSSGIYFYEMRTDKFVSLKKLLLVK